MNWAEILQMLKEYEFVFTPLTIIVSLLIFRMESINTKQGMESETFDKIFGQIIMNDLPKCITKEPLDGQELENKLQELMRSASYYKYMTPYFYKEIVYRIKQIERLSLDSAGKKYRIYISGAKYERLLKKKTAGIIRLISSFSRGKRMRCRILRFPLIAFLRERIDMIRRHYWDWIKNTYYENENILFLLSATGTDIGKGQVIGKGTEREGISFDIELSNKVQKIIGVDAIEKSGLFHFGIWRVYATRSTHVNAKMISDHKIKVVYFCRGKDCLHKEIKTREKYAHLGVDGIAKRRKRIYLIVRTKDNRRIAYKEIRLELNPNTNEIRILDANLDKMQKE